MKTAAVIFFFLMLAASPRPVLSQTGFKVRGITIAGNRAFSENVILQQMETKWVNWFSEHILQKDPILFNPEILKSDLESIRTFYQREGYLFVQLSPPKVEINQKAGTAALIIRIEEHTPVLVKEVVLSQPDIQQASRHETDSLLARARSGLLLKQKTVFRDAHLNADRKTLLSSLANGGYPFATANYTLAVDTVDTLVSVCWMITPGHSAVFDTVSISGNDKVDADMILEKLTFKKGDRYDAAKLAVAQMAVYNLGLFNAVNMRAELEDTTASGVPVNIALKEALQFKVFMGIGYGKEEQLRLTAEIRMLNVIGDADRLNLEFKSSAIQPYEVKITYIQPDFLFDDMTLSLIPTVRSETESAYSMKRIGSTISLDYPLFKNLRGSIGYGQENVDLDTASIASTNPPQQVLETYAKNSVHMALLSSNAAPLFDPVRGMSASLQFTFSGITEDNPYQFSRVLFDLKRYDRLRESTILAARFAIGTIHPVDEDGFIPVEERFYAGGSNSNRGWARFQLGPKDPSGKSAGGNSMIDGSLEFRQQLVSRFSLVLFTDYSEVNIQPSTYTLSDLHFAAGLGLRYNTAIGPIRLDIAKPVFEGDLPVQYILSIGHAY